MTTFVFTLITGTPDFQVTLNVPFDAIDLFDAVKQLKQYLSVVTGYLLVIVSYNYVIISDDNQIYDHVMSDDFYNKYILEDF